MGTLKQITAYLAALLTALCLAVPAAQAQTISNTAAAQWTERGTSYSAVSNTVSFDLSAAPGKIDTFVGNSTGQPLAFNPSDCGGHPVIIPGGLTGSTVVASVEQTAQARIGDTLFFRVSAPGANTNPNAVDSVTATLVTTSGDRETFLVYETAPNSGVFIGAIPTSAIPPQPVQGDCHLSVSPGDRISIDCIKTGSSNIIATAQIDVLADPFGLVFDSEDGSPVNGVRVTLVDAITGAPARVFADDGVAPWPSVVFTGQSITDGAGNVYQQLPGEYRFPLAALGQYRLVVEPVAPYTAPSTATAAQLAGLRRPDGHPLVLLPASWGGVVTLSNPAPVRIDIPLDHPPVAVSLTKTASRPRALPGDVVFYTVTAQNPDAQHAKHGVTLVDTASTLLRLRPGTVRIDGVAAPGVVTAAPDGHSLTIALGDIAAGAARTVTYAMTVRADAPAGQALNRITATDSRGLSNTAAATVQIDRDNLAARMTLIGRVTAGGCAVDAPHPGVPGVRVVLEDGSFAITDADGRYHFDGLVPGSHVVQVLDSTLPKGGAFTDCTRSTRSTGSASSRFVIGQGGSLQVADFSAMVPEGSLPAAPQPAMTRGVTGKAATVDQPATTGKPDAEAERTAAGATTDWLALGDGPTEFLFPAIDHNPRAPAIRVVIRHRADQKVALSVNGRPADPLSFDGSRAGPGGTYAISIWRGIPLDGEVTHLSAAVKGPDGVVMTTLTRDVHFASTPARIELMPAQSRLVADGSTRPVLALRILDSTGHPVHAGLSGEFNLSAPYESAEALDAMQSRALSGLGRSAPRWFVKGDDGIAYVELAPTMVSGKLHMEFNFSDSQQRRRQELDAWVVPGDQPWTLVGLAEGAVGSRSIADNMERTGRLDSDLGDHARVAFYAKGRVLGKYLLTAAYDSAKQRDDQVLMGAIDPRAYYTVFADGSDRRHDAASREKLYVRIETSTFYAIYGDFEAGFNQTQLARYQRAATGFKAELNRGAVHAQGFAAKIASTHRHDEIQGGGLSGPYRLSSRAIIAGSEVVNLEVRDRFRSELIVSHRTLTRFVDYDIDLLAGTISFKQPVLSRDSDLNPQFIVIDYDVDEAARGGKINAGLRADYTTAGGKVRIGASALTDTTVGGGNGERTWLGAVDLKARLGESTEIRAETAMSYAQAKRAIAWLIEVEHHDGQLDLLAYARSADRAFGLGQTGSAELGRRKLGLDARYRISELLSLTASAWHDDSLEDRARRDAVQFGATWRTRRTDARLGLAMMRDRLKDGSSRNSTVLEGGVTQRLFDNRLELSATSSIALDKAESADLPERHRLVARYALNSDIKLVGNYEIAKGAQIDARTAQLGFELTPWSGARVTTALGQQNIAELGKRSFAAFGLAQSVPLTRNLTLDATIDSNRTLSGFDPASLVNPAHPLSSSGTLGENGSLAEDFTAYTMGGTWRAGRWSATLRGEWRDGDLGNRKGMTFGAIRQLGEGAMIGTGFNWTHAVAVSGASSEIYDGAVAMAVRPANSDLAFLTKIQLRSDVVHDAVAGDTGPAGRGALTITGQGQATRVIASFSSDWTPRGHDNGAFVQRNEVNFFAAARYNFDSYQGYNLKGTTLIGGGSLRIGLGERIELGGSGTVRHTMDDGTTSFSFGPQIGITPAKDVLLIVGYNFAGYRDPDFSAANNTDKGLYATLRMKFDADTFRFLGLGR